MKKKRLVQTKLESKGKENKRTREHKRQKEKEQKKNRMKRSARAGHKVTVKKEKKGRESLREGKEKCKP